MKKGANGGFQRPETPYMHHNYEFESIRCGQRFRRPTHKLPAPVPYRPHPDECRRTRCDDKNNNTHECGITPERSPDFGEQTTSRSLHMHARERQYVRS